MSLSRRRLLKGLGAALTLPALVSLAPRGARAKALTPPPRLLIVTAPNGMWMPDWLPSAPGLDWPVSPLLAPLDRHRDQLSIVTGLVNGPLGVGDIHLTANAALLTGRAPDASFNEDLGAGQSVDQAAASALFAQAKAAGRAPRLASLELSSEAPSLCDAGIGQGLGGSCTYMWTVSWANATTPLSRLVQPRAAFERAFGPLEATPSSAAAQARRIALQRSVLDTVQDDLTRLTRQVAREDAQRLDAWATHLRTVEQRLDTPVLPPDSVCGVAQSDLAAHLTAETTFGLPEHVGRMLDISALALQCDATRVATYMLGHARSDRPFPHLGIEDSHHWLSHHVGDASKIAKINQIGVWEVEQFSSLLDRLSQAPAEDGSPLLDHTLVVFVSNFGDPNSHDFEGIPVVVAGGTALGHVPKGVIGAQVGAPLARLHLSLLQRLGVPATSFGDLGTSPLSVLT